MQMKNVNVNEIEKNDELLLLVYKNGDNPVLCKKSDFDINIVSIETIVLEITVDKISTVKNIYSLVEKV